VAPGKVEVIEVFWYACPHCYALDPYLESWRKSKPAYVEFHRVPVTWGEIHREHARLFYALEALGKEDALHADVFAEMHDRKNYMFAQGNERETLAAEQSFVQARGISAGDFSNAWNSFTVQTNLQKADDLVRRYRIEGVPLIIINGKYLTDVNMAGTPANVISIINDLAASEKRR
jgi:thiol:disulfide interchange protein DsbA